MAEGGEEVFVIRIEVKTENADTTVHHVREELEHAEHSALELNAALELLKKGFEALKEILDIPFELVREFDKVFLSTTNLRIALAGVGDASEETFQHVQHLVKELAENSRFSQVAIRDAAVLAVTYGNQGDQLERLLQVSADYAQNQQVDIATGVVRIQRAMESGNITIKRVSQNVSQLTEASARADDVLKKLGQRFKDAAKAATEGGAGGLIQFGKVFDEFKEALGGIIAETPEFEAVIATATDTLAALVALLETNREEISHVFGEVLRTGGHLFLEFLNTVLLAVKSIGSALFSVAEILHSILQNDNTDYFIANIKTQLATLEALKKKSAEFGYADNVKKLDVEIDKLNADLAVLEKKKVNPFDQARGAADDFVKSWDKAVDVVLAGIAKLFGGKSIEEHLAERLAQFRSQTHERPTVGGTRFTTEQTDILSKLDHGMETYEGHLRAITKLEEMRDAETGKAIITTEQAHELRLKFAQEDLAASRTWAAGLVRAYSAAQEAAENYAGVVVDAFGVANDTIINVLDKLENYNANTWRQIASDAIHAIQEIINKLIAAKLIGLIGQGIAGITLGGGGGTAVVGAEARAQGGPVIGGRTYLVGEREPELFTAPRDGQITPMSKMTAQSTARPVIVKIANYTDPDEIRKFLMSKEGEIVVKNAMSRGRVSAFGGGV